MSLTTGPFTCQPLASTPGFADTWRQHSFNSTEPNKKRSGPSVAIPHDFPGNPSEPERTQRVIRGRGVQPQGGTCWAPQRSRLRQFFCQVAITSVADFQC